MKKILFFALAGFVLASCGGFLEEKSQSEVIPKTTSDFSELLLGSGYPEPMGNPRFNETFLLDDDVQLFLSHSSFDSRVGIDVAIENSFKYTWQPQMMDYNGYNEPINQAAAGTTYGSFYDRIKGCNAVLDMIDTSIGTQEEKDRVKGEALALRAYYYFWLVNLYGEPYNSLGGKEALGVPVKPTSDLSDDPLPRETVGYIYDEIIVPDMQQAIELLDPLPIIRKNRRIDQPALHILLSRVYLYMDRFEDCVAEVDKAIEQGITLTNYADPAFVGSILTADVINDANPEVEWWYGSTPVQDIQAYRAATDPQFTALYDKVNDVRFAAFGFVPDGDGDVLMKKPRANLGSRGGMAVRAPEAYLNRAEAYALMGGHDAEAMADLNLLRQNRIVGYVDESLTDAALLDAVRLERRKELCYEGHRWFDLRRQGMKEISHLYKATKGGATVRYTLAERDAMWTLPFPNSVILNNSSTDMVMPQNPSAFLPMRGGATVQ